MFGIFNVIGVGYWFQTFRKRSCMILRVLKTIRDFISKYRRAPYTRELLNLLRTWGYGHETLKLCEKLGLVYRYEAPHPHNEKIMCKYNTLTDLGWEILTATGGDYDNPSETPQQDDDNNNEEEEKQEDEPP